MATPILPNEKRQPTIHETVKDLQGYFQSNESNIMMTLLLGIFAQDNPANIANQIELMTGVNRNQLLLNMHSTEIMQPMNSRAINSKGDVVLTGSTIEPDMWKVDNLLDYTTIWEKYTRALTLQQNGLVPGSQNPLELHELIIQQMREQIAHDMRKVIWTGDKALANTSADAITNGFLKKFKEAATASKLTPKAITGITSANIFAKILTLVNSLGTMWRRQPDTIVLVASDVWEKLTEAAAGNSTSLLFQFNNPNRDQIFNHVMSIPLPQYPNIKIYEEPYLPVGAMVATVKRNLICGVDTASAPLDATQYGANPREILVYGQGMLGVGVRQFDAPSGSALQTAFVCNEQAIV
jgi:hypothetical protein